MNDVLTEREVARMAIATLHHLARACYAAFLAEDVRRRIRATEYAHKTDLEAYLGSMVPVGPSARLAWLELDQDCRDLADKATENPDRMLLWLDFLPNLVLTTLLTSKTPENAPEPAQTH